ncbi:PEP-CTERM sorting domain-containing protein [Sphingomonas sp. RS6]
MKNAVRFFLVGSASLFALCSTADAQTEYRFHGTFRPATGAAFTAMLGDGSFDGHYSLADPFPTSGVAYFLDYTVNIRDADGAILLTLSQGSNGAYGYINTGVAQYYGGTSIYFYDLSQNYLQLIVPTGFGGTGDVLANGYSYAQIAPQNQATVMSGVIGVPEPGLWGLMLAGIGMAGAAMRVRRVRVGWSSSTRLS